MPRAYTIDTAALTLETSVKWLDNVLSHNRVHGVTQKRQGVSRRLSVDGLLILGLAFLLIHDLGVPTTRAIALAEDLARNEGRHRTPHGLNIDLDLGSFQTRLLERLENAVEVAPAPRRGRPPIKKTGRLD
jgi:hypothetical protein